MSGRTPISIESLLEQQRLEKEANAKVSNISHSTLELIYCSLKHLNHASRSYLCQAFLIYRY